MGGTIYFAHGSSGSRGVALLVLRKLIVNVNLQSTDTASEGRILVINWQIGKHPVAVICIYASTKDNIPFQMSFVKIIKENVEKYTDKLLIIWGDLKTYKTLT